MITIKPLTIMVPIPTPPGPGPLPPVPINTVRVRTSDGNVPIKSDLTSYETATLVTGTSDVYDVYKSGNSFYALLFQSTNVIEALDVNTTGITYMDSMFQGCTSLTSVTLFDTSKVTDMSHMFSGCSNLTTVPLFNTSNVTNMDSMFYGCSNLTTVPLFNTAKVTDMSWLFANCTSLTSVPLFNTYKVNDIHRMFSGCTNVQSGALALYQQASSQVTPPSRYDDTFYNCGKNTTTGAAELAQIPSSWGGTGA